MPIGLAPSDVMLLFEGMQIGRQESNGQTQMSTPLNMKQVKWDVSV